MRFLRLRWRFGSLLFNQLAFFGAKPRMPFRQIEHPSPNDQPEKPQQSRQNKRRTPSPPKINPHRKNRSDRAANRRSAVKKRRRHSSFLLRKPFRNCFRRSRPIRGFPRPQQKTERRETVKATRQRSA